MYSPLFMRHIHALLKLHLPGFRLILYIHLLPVLSMLSPGRMMAQNVGIGVSSPQEKLHITSSVRIEDPRPGLNFYQGTTQGSRIEHYLNGMLFWNMEDGAFYFNSSSANRFAISDAGNVGINNSSPAERLHVKSGNIRIENSVPALNLFQGNLHTATLNQTGTNTLLKNLQPGNMGFFTNNLERMTIDAQGKVGIGTISPVVRLHVLGNSKMDSLALGLPQNTSILPREKLEVYGNTRLTTLSILDPAELQFYYGSATRAKIYGTNANHLFLAAGNETGQAGNVYLVSDGLSRVTVDHEGNTGIGSGFSSFTPPRQQLDVNGKIEVGNDDKPPSPGAQRYNSDRKDMEFWNGQKWISMSGGEGLVLPEDVDDVFSDVGGSYPSVRMNDDGDAIVAWVDSAQVYVAQRIDGEWILPSGQMDFINPDGGNLNICNYPKVAIDANGNALVVWTQQHPVHGRRLYMSEYRNGVWTHPAGVDDHISFAETAYDLAVEMSDDGQAIIAWRQLPAATYQLYISEYRNNVWNHATDITDQISFTCCPTDHFSIAISNTATLVSFEQYLQGKYRIYLSEYRNGTWQYPSDTSDYVGLPSHNVLSGSALNAWHWDMRVAVNNDGNAILIWKTFTPISPLFRVRYVSQVFQNGAWSAFQYITSVDNVPSNELTWFHVDAVGLNDNGFATFLWSDADGVLHIMQTADDLGDFESMVEFPGLSENETSNDVYELEISTNNHDEVFVTWAQGGLRNAVYQGNRWTGPKVRADIQSLLHPDLTVNPFVSSTMNADREALVFWSQTENLYKAEY